MLLGCGFQLFIFIVVGLGGPSLSRVSQSTEIHI